MESFSCFENDYNVNILAGVECKTKIQKSFQSIPCLHWNKGRQNEWKLLTPTEAGGRQRLGHREGRPRLWPPGNRLRRGRVGPSAQPEVPPPAGKPRDGAAGDHHSQGGRGPGPGPSLRGSASPFPSGKREGGRGPPWFPPLLSFQQLAVYHLQEITGIKTILSPPFDEK